MDAVSRPSCGRTILAARFYALTRDEIHQFVTHLGFQPLALRGVVELVSAKIVLVGDPAARSPIPALETRLRTAFLC